jgi:ABC transporter substrate binding protein
MRRRNLIFGLLAVAATGRARAAERKSSHRIAIVQPSGPLAEITASGEPFWQAIFNELRRLGYVEGDNLLIERYSGEGRAAHYPELARAVVSRNPDLIIIFTNNLTLDFKAATTTIPIVGTFASPVEMGIVASLARPGGNITGVSVDVGQSSGASGFNCCSSWCRRRPDSGSSKRERCWSSGEPLNANSANGGELPGLARRSTLRWTRRHIAAYSPV